MDVVKRRKAISSSQSVDKVYANELISMFEVFPHITTLSLDCFDTLLWRKTMAPYDVFYDLQHKPTFHAMGLTAALRMHGEGKARQLAAFNKKNAEIRLADVYMEIFPSLDESALMALVEEELAMEMEVCYAFPSVIKLIEEAYNRGLKIIIVSDTYFNESQLRRLLTSAMPKKIVAMIDTIFCSCDWGKSKENGLFSAVLKKLNQSAESILHVGDNLIADYVSAKSSNINARHLLQQNETIDNLQKLYTISTNIIDPKTRINYSLAHPFRGVLAMNSVNDNHPETLIGYAGLGPIMYAFAHFICEEVKRLKENDEQIKVIFLLRDGYLPALSCEAFLGESVGTPVCISRFASYAASFRSEQDIDRYLLEVGETNRYRDLAHQLLLPEELIDNLIKKVEKSAEPMTEFIYLLHQKEIVKTILQNSEEYCQRLVQHLHNETGLRVGDTLVLVDLGYYGTTQRRLTPVFSDLGIKIVGRYLIALETPQWQSDRAGLIDPSWCDDKAMHTLVFYIMLLEQLCTSNGRSVIDYDEEGNAIYSETSMSQQQHMKLTCIQAECVRFIHEAKLFFQKAQTSVSSHMLRQTAMGELVRLIFFPTEAELFYLESFQAEMNLGTKDILQIFDADQGLIGLRKRGMLYMEKPSRVTRTNYPTELRVAGIELVLSLIVQHRFNLDISMKNMMLRRESLSAIFMQGQEKYETQIEAIATHDGFYSVWIPTRLQVAIVFGKSYQWIQIDSVELIEMNAFISQSEAQNTADGWRAISPIDMLEKCVHSKNGKLFECTSDSAALVLTPNLQPGAIETVCRIVFRPIMKHDS